MGIETAFACRKVELDSIVRLHLTLTLKQRNNAMQYNAIQRISFKVHLVFRYNGDEDEDQEDIKEDEKDQTIEQ